MTSQAAHERLLLLEMIEFPPFGNFKALEDLHQ